MSVLILRHLDVIAASMQIVLAQIEVARHALTLSAPEPVGPTLPPSCVGVPEERCAIRDVESARKLMGGVVVCVGCQERLTPQ